MSDYAFGKFFLYKLMTVTEIQTDIAGNRYA